MDDRAFDSPDFLERLRRGEEGAYRQLVRRYHGMFRQDVLTVCATPLP